MVDELDMKLRQTLQQARALLKQILEHLDVIAENTSDSGDDTDLKRLREALVADCEGLQRLLMNVLDGQTAANFGISLRMDTLHTVRRYLAVLQQKNENNCEAVQKMHVSVMKREALCMLFEEYANVLSDAQQYAKESQIACEKLQGNREEFQCMRSAASPAEMDAQKYKEWRSLAEIESLTTKTQNREACSKSCPPPPCASAPMPAPPPCASAPVPAPPPCASAPFSTPAVANKKPGPAATKKRINPFRALLLGFKKKEKVIPPPTMDQVQFSAVAPATVVCGKYMPLNVIMYAEGYRVAVENVIAELDGNAKETRTGFHSVQRDSVVKVVLTSPDIVVDDGINEQKWDGNYLDFMFAVKIPGDFAEEQILFNASVYINDVIATKLKLIVDCTGKKKVSVNRADISSAFVSYASEDRNRVAAIIQGMRKARPDLDIFFDVENLRSGQNWQETLKDEIAERDVLFLCWSNFAKASKWVDMEWRYALESKGEECIEPIPIESPDVCPPPAELHQKHFNDKMLYIIKATSNKF